LSARGDALKNKNGKGEAREGDGRGGVFFRVSVSLFGDFCQAFFSFSKTFFFCDG